MKGKILLAQRHRLAVSSGDVWDIDLRTGAGQMSRNLKRSLGYEESETADTVEALDALVHLKRYATVTRYPGAEKISLAEARGAVAAARRIRRVIRPLLAKARVRPPGR